MPIKITCPHCKQVLNVKDHLAGKKGPCPACKKILTVPTTSSSATNTPALPSTPTVAQTNGTAKPKEPKPPAKAAAPPPPPEDAEAAAAAAFADEPPSAAETAAPTFIDFNCPQCDEPLHLAAELAGKRASCPECKRIIKVPEIKKVEKADWRKTNAAGLPSGARRPDQPVPEGAWGSAAATNVSVEALEEANVLPDRYARPLTVQQKIIRGILIAAVAGVFFSLVGGAIAWWMSSREARALKSVEDYAASPAATEKIGREGVAALHIGIGEYYLSTKRPDPDGTVGAKKAEKEFGKAIETLTSQQGAAVKESERDALLTDLALLQIDLGGSKDEIDQKTRLNWDDTQKAIRTTLGTMHNSEARLDAFRAVCRRLIAKKQAKRALALAAQISGLPTEQAEAVGIAGLELLAASEQTLAEEALTKALAYYPQDEQQAAEAPQLMPSFVALAVAMNREKWPKPKQGEEEDNEAIGRAAGLARKGQWDAAREKARSIQSPGRRLQAFIELAEAGEAKSDNPDLQEAIKLATELRNQPRLVWLKLRLADLAIRSGVDNQQIDGLIAAIEDRSLASRVRLLVLRNQLTAKNPSTESPLLDESPPTVWHYVARQTIANHKRSADNKLDDADRAFSVIGALTGSLSK